jgi:RNA polymerase sigma factor (sigma-70 family)
MRVLVVDDEPAIVAGIQAILELHGIEAEGAWDCDSAEERITGEFFPVILADLRMRTDDCGMRLIDAARRLSPRSAVATMTAYANAATEARLLERGASFVLAKPFQEDVLIGAVREMLLAVEAAAAAHAADDDALYNATIGTLHAISRGRFGFVREDAEDLVQEAWLLFLEKRRDVQTPKAWLSGTVANLCRQEIERRYRDRERSAEMPEIAVSRNEDDILSVRAALARIDERSRALCTMIGLEQRSYDEASADAGIPLGSVGPLYMRAKDKLRKAFVAQG